MQGISYQSMKNQLTEAEDITADRKNALYQLPKQAAVIVFPTKKHALARLAGKKSSIPGIAGKDGITGLVEMQEITVKKGWEDYDTKDYYRQIKRQGKVGMKKVKQLVVADWFAEYLSKDKLLYECSAKIYEVVTYVEREDTGLTYLAEEFYQTNCLAIAAALESRTRPLKNSKRWPGEGIRWTAFNHANVEDWLDANGNITIAKAPRYMIYTSGIDANVRAQSLALASHPANVNGDYLILVIATEVGTVGININNGAAVFFNTPRFTPAAMRQTEDRVFRGRQSHKEALRLAALRGKDYVKVEVRYMVARVDPSVREEYPDVLEIDSLLYRVIYEKAFRFGLFFRMWKRIAVDAPVNRRRNMRITDRPRTEDTDYVDERYYQLIGFDDTLPIDYSTYNIYYSEESIPRVTEVIRELFEKRGNYPVSGILDILSTEYDFSQQEVANAIRHLVETSELLLHDRYGYPQYLAESQGMLYITRDTALVPEPSLHYYSANAIYTDQDILEDYAAKNTNISHSIDKLDKLKSPASYKHWYSELDAYKKIKLFEAAYVIVIQSSEDDAPIPWVVKVLDCASNLYAIDESDDTAVHEIELVYSKTTNYNAVDGLLRPSGHLRIFRDGIWRHTNELERPYYAKIMEAKMEKILLTYYDKFRDIGILGIVVRHDLVHIREFQYDPTTSSYSSSEGTKCTGLSAYALVGMIFDVTNPAVTITNTVKDNIQTVRQVFKVGTATIRKLSKKKLEYYAQRVESGLPGKTELCHELCSALLSIGAVFAIIGSASATISKMT
jgi:hypothetical protein